MKGEEGGRDLNQERVVLMSRGKCEGEDFLVF